MTSFIGVGGLEIFQQKEKKRRVTYWDFHKRNHLQAKEV